MSKNSFKVIIAILVASFLALQSPALAQQPPPPNIPLTSLGGLICGPNQTPRVDLAGVWQCSDDLTLTERTADTALSNAERARRAAVAAQSTADEAQATAFEALDIGSRAEVTATEALQELGAHSSDPNAHHTPTIPTIDTSAADCGPGEVLTGDDVCIDLAALICQVVGDVGACDTEKLVFVTSQTFNGDLVSAAFVLTGILPADGLGAGDLICQNLADNAGLPGTYLPWLSDGLAGSPSTRFLQATVPYVRVDGVTVADDYAQLTSCPFNFTPCLQAKPNVTEFGVTLPDSSGVWTGTARGGGPTGKTCQNWTSGVSVTGNDGKAGTSSLLTKGWTEGGQFPCGINFRLYCMQQ